MTTRLAGKQRTLDAILDAARALFEADGFDDVTMEAIAQRAGVSKGSVFFHCRSKAALLNLLFSNDMLRWIDAAFREPPVDDVVDDLTAKFTALQLAMGRVPSLSKVFMQNVAFATDDADHVRKVMDDLIGRTVDVLERFEQTGSIELTVPSTDVAWNLFSTYFMCQLAWLGWPDERRTHPAELLRPRFAAQLDPIRHIR